MAEIQEWIAFVTVIDSKLKESTVEVRVAEADAQAYFAAADPAAQGATDVGLLLSRISLCSDGVRTKYGVRVQTANDTSVPPAVDSDIFNSDKVTVGFKSGLDNYAFTIPAWKRSAFDQIGRDGSMALDSPTQAANLVTSLEAVARSKNGSPITVTYIRKVK